MNSHPADTAVRVQAGREGPHDSLVDAIASVTVPVVVLDDSERSALHERATEAHARIIRWGASVETVLEEAMLLSSSLPDQVTRVLHRVRTSQPPGGGVVVRALPVDSEIPPTPTASRRGELLSQLPVAALVQLAVATRLGEPFAFADENDGRLVHDIVPVRGSEDRQENSGSTLLELHTENGFHPYRPEFVTLMGIRSDHERRAKTLLLGLNEILPGLSSGCREALRQPVYRIRVGSSFSPAAWGVASPPLRVLDRDDSLLSMDLHAMEGLTDEAQSALSELRDVVTARLRGTVVGQGDLVVIDNRAAIHGRTSFRARYDGTDRWLRRVFVTSDLRRFAHERFAGTRVCKPLSELEAWRAAAATVHE